MEDPASRRSAVHRDFAIKPSIRFVGPVWSGRHPVTVESTGSSPVRGAGRNRLGGNAQVGRRGN